MSDQDYRTRFVTKTTKQATLGNKTFPSWTEVLPCLNIPFKWGKDIRLIVPAFEACILNRVYTTFKESEEYFVFRNFEKQTGNIIKPRSDTDFYDHLELRILSIWMSIWALEAFYNLTAPKDLHFEYQKKKDSQVDIITTENLTDKWLWIKTYKIFPFIFDKEPISWSLKKEFDRLKDIRDRIMHVKFGSVSNSKYNTESLWGDIIDPKQRNPANIIKDIMLYYSPDDDSKKERFLREIIF